MVNSEMPADLPGSPGNDEPGGFRVGFGDEVPRKRLNLNDLSLGFEDGQPDLVTGRRVFGKTITGLGSALAEYARVIEGREHVLASCIDVADIDPEVLGASDRVHEALFSLRTAHQGYTGHSFLGDPLLRERHETENESAAEGTAEDRAGAPAEGPSHPELGVCLPLDKLLQSGSGTMVQLTSARVYGDGVMLGVECALVRGEYEGAEAWERRNNPPLDFIDFAVRAIDPLSGTTHWGIMQGASRRDFNRMQRWEGELWIPGTVQAQQLDCTLRVRHLVNINGDAGQMYLAFNLDPADLREAAARAHRPGDSA